MKIRYTSEQFNAIVASGIDSDLIQDALAAGVPADQLLQWAKSKANIPNKIAGYAEELAAEQERLANLPIRVRAGRDEGTILKSGKNKGQQGDATGALIVVSGSARVFEACTPGQIACILANPGLAIDLATQVDAGNHDGRGYTRDATYSAADDLAVLLEQYTAAGLIKSADAPATTAKAA